MSGAGGLLLTVMGLGGMVVGLLLIPLGLPGLWLMVGVLAAGALAGAVSWTTLVAVAGLGLLAELGEYLAVQRYSVRYGGDTWAFAGAIVGGILGALVGTPVPVLGSVLGLVAGTFAGAVAVAWYRSRDLTGSLRVGRGAVLGRAAATALKTTAGLVALGVGAAALLIG